MSGDSTTCENTAVRLLGASGGASSSLRSCHDITFSPLVSGTKTTETQVRPRAQNWHNVFERVSNALRLDLVEMHILVMNPRRRGWLLAVILASPLLFILLAVSADQKISGLDVTWPHTCQVERKHTRTFIWVETRRSRRWPGSKLIERQWITLGILTLCIDEDTSQVIHEHQTQR